VKHQYVGDINDYRKYALLRALSAGGMNRIGVCWMLTPDDGGTHGGMVEWPEEWRGFDHPVSDLLKSINRQPERRNLRSIEQSGLIDATFHSEMLPQAVEKRAAYMAACRSKFANTDLVFFDPDNGLEVALQKGRRNSSKYLYLDEVAALYSSGKSLMIYQHFPRVERAKFTAFCTNRLRIVAPNCAIWLFSTSHVAFFLLVHPESPARIAVAAMDACGRFAPSFIRGEYLTRAVPVAA
jgi:hypothetical protein